MERKKTQEIIEKTNIYNDSDSGKVFLLILLIPILFGLVLSYIVTSVAEASEIKVESITSQVWYAVVYSVLQLLVYLAIFLLYNKNKKISFKASKFTSKMSVTTYLIVIAVGVISLFGLQYFINAVDIVLKKIGYPLEEGLVLLEPDSWWKYLIGIVILAVFPAFYEELLFRGVILQGLRSRFGDISSVLLSSAMFALMHGSLQQLIYPFLLGCIMGWIVLRTGSLFSSMIVHFINNFLVVTFAYIKNVTGFSMNLPGQWWFYLVAILLLVLTAGILFLIDRFYFHHRSKEEVARTSTKTSKFIYISLAVAAVLFVFITVTEIVAG